MTFNSFQKNEADCSFAKLRITHNYSTSFSNSVHSAWGESGQRGPSGAFWGGYLVTFLPSLPNLITLGHYFQNFSLFTTITNRCVQFHNKWKQKYNTHHKHKFKKILFKKNNYERSFWYKDLRLPCSSAYLTSMCNVFRAIWLDINESLPNVLTIKFTSTYFLKSIN